MCKKEIGGYIELDTYHGKMLHEGAVALNCGRNALAYLFRTKKIKALWMPKFICDSVINVCHREGVDIKYYRIDCTLKPVEEITLDSNEWFYLINYFGQIKNEDILYLKSKYDRIIVDQAQSYFQMPLKNVDTLYTCRKYFGVADGAFLYTDNKLNNLERDESYDRMRFLLGRYDRTASEFYVEYVANNQRFANEPIKLMSRVTENLLHGIDYEFVRKRRTENYTVLNDAFKAINKLNLIIPDGPFMYPLYIPNAAKLRKLLQKNKVYIPTLWPGVYNICSKDELEYDLASNILPLPIDQRYCTEEMKYLINSIHALL